MTRLRPPSSSTSRCFCADTQPAELQALRELAALWMERLAEFRPHLSGAVWRGTATRLNDIHLQLYCDDTSRRRSCCSTRAWTTRSAAPRARVASPWIG